MTNHDEGDDNGDNGEHEGVNDNGNTASVLGSDSPIFDLITAPWFSGGRLGNNNDGAAATSTYVFIHCNIYTL